MAIDTKKRKKIAICDNTQDNCKVSNKKENCGEKRKNSSGNKLEKTELVDNKGNRTACFKPIVKNSVICNNTHALGLASRTDLLKFRKEIVLNQLKKFELYKSQSPFDRRVTAITWHPTYPQIFVAGSKGGDILLHNINSNEDYFSVGVGAGGSILGLKCSDVDQYTVVTASLTGKICSENLHSMKSKVLYSLPFSLDNWFTSLDICKNHRTILTGDCKGNTYLLGPSGELIWQKRKLHTAKVTHCEFNIHDPNIIITSSLDSTVKLWDLRSVSESKASKTGLLQPLATFHHLKAVNSAYFSPSNGINILTTDQHSELRIYSGPLWDEMIKITHPHRQFQHMTQIKAVWHPMEDIVIAGRYPDDNIQKDDLRTIDFYDGSNGQLLHKILSPTNNIVSLNAVNSTGEILASAAGFTVVYLKNKGGGGEGGSESESDEDVEVPAVDIKKNNKKRAKAKVINKPCPKKKVPSKKISP